MNVSNRLPGYKTGYWVRERRRHGWLRQSKKEFVVSELYEVYVFCAFYSGVVIFSLWMTIADRAPKLERVRVQNK